MYVCMPVWVYVCVYAYVLMHKCTWTAHELRVQIQGIWIQSARAGVDLHEDLHLSTVLDYPFAIGNRADFW